MNIISQLNVNIKKIVGKYLKSHKFYGEIWRTSSLTLINTEDGLNNIMMIIPID